ncbi:MAG: LysR family transcriptional regulator substrate-binding protein, partial [Dorea sp.]
YKVKPDIKYTLNNDFSILSMVEHGLGLSILPGLMLRGRTENVEIRPLKPWSYRKLGLAILSKEDLTPAAKIFIKYAQDYLLD